MVDQWMPGVVRRPGPPEKVGYSFRGESGPKRGEVDHSAEGYWGGIHATLDDLDRRASWQFTVGYDRIEQHYPLEAHCWHAGDVDDNGAVAANIDLIGKEHLGLTPRGQIIGPPLTPYQLDASARITRWASAQYTLTRYGVYPQQDRVWTLAWHKWVSDVYTACPSNRTDLTAIICTVRAALAGVEEGDMRLIRTPGGYIYLEGGGTVQYVRDMTHLRPLGLELSPVNVAAEYVQALKDLGPVGEPLPANPHTQHILRGLEGLDIVTRP